MIEEIQRGSSNFFEHRNEIELRKNSIFAAKVLANNEI